jgi:hypothetical protein
MALYVCQLDKRNDDISLAVTSIQQSIYAVEARFAIDKEYDHVSDDINGAFKNIQKNSYAIG